MTSRIEQKESRWRTKFALLTLCALLVALCFPAQAQQSTEKIPRIGIVRAIATAPAPSIKIFRQALQDLGYVEGKNIQFEYRYTEGSRDQASQELWPNSCASRSISFSLHRRS